MASSVARPWHSPKSQWQSPLDGRGGSLNFNGLMLLENRDVLLDLNDMMLRKDLGGRSGCQMSMSDDKRQRQ
jgi:hypothetical protein